jgi:hypothetical protein
MNDRLSNVKDRQEKKISDISKTLRSEFHFLRFPFFDLSPRSSKKDRIEIKEIIKTEEGDINIWWKVIRGLDNKLPSSFARKIHKEVVEKAINDLKRPIPRLIKLGSLWQICKKANITPAGRNYEEIRRVLKDIKTATIDVKGTFRQKEKAGTKKFYEGIFNLYDMVFFAGETLPDGTEADVVYVLLSDMYVQNFNNNFVVPLDYQYFQSLEGDIASRMYEVLSVWFFPALENGKKYIQKHYSEICSYFPLIRQDPKWKAKGQLKSAHRQHIATGFLASEPEWIDTYEKSDWLLRYYIGPKAKDWYRQNKKLGTGDEGIKQINVVPIEESERKTRENPGKKKVEDTKVIKIEQLTLQFEENPLVSQLVSIGVAKSVAISLTSRIDGEIITNQVEALPLRSNLVDKPAFLVKAILENYPLPEAFKNKLAGREYEKEAKLKEEYHDFIIDQVDIHLQKCDKAVIEREIEEFRPRFMDVWNIDEIAMQAPLWKAQLKHDYKIHQKAKTLNIPSFEDWKANHHKAGVTNL